MDRYQAGCTLVWELGVIVHNALSFQMFANMARGTPAAVPAPPGRVLS